MLEPFIFCYLRGVQLVILIHGPQPYYGSAKLSQHSDPTLTLVPVGDVEASCIRALCACNCLIRFVRLRMGL